VVVRLAAILAFFAVASPVAASVRECSKIDVRVASEDPILFASTCDAARIALERLASVELTLSNPTDIVVVSQAEALHHGRVASYASARNVITILAPETIEDQTSSASAFARIEVETFFAGLVIHELAHVALYETYGAGPGPLAHEYVAYALQIDFLGSEDRKAFLQGFDVEGAASLEYLNAGILMLSPDVFAGHAWHHFNSEGADAEAVVAAMTGRLQFPMDDIPW
jgi:hypothetical protein